MEFLEKQEVITTTVSNQIKVLAFVNGSLPFFSDNNCMRTNQNQKKKKLKMVKCKVFTHLQSVKSFMADWLASLMFTTHFI